MNEQGIREVLRELGCDSIRLCGDHIRANCPLAPYLHKKGTDRHPSFLVKIESADKSCYHCFSCNSRGTFTGLLYELQRYGAFISPELLERVQGMERQDPVQKARERPSIFSKEFLLGQKQHEEEVWAEEEYAPYSGKVHKYLLNRGVDIATCQRWDLGYDPEKRRVLFPVRRFGDSALVGMMGRTIDEGVEPTYLTYFNFKKSSFLYGEHFLKDISKPVLGDVFGYDLPAQSGVILVEGMMDVLKLFRMGYENVVGLMTATISKRQIRTLKRTGRDIYLMMDWDYAGMTGRKKVVEAFAGKQFVYDVPGITCCKVCGNRWSEISDSLEYVCRKCKSVWEVDPKKKDPDGLTHDEILGCLDSAKKVKISS